MLYFFTGEDKLPCLSSIQGLEVRKVDDPLFMAVLGQLPLEESRNRMTNDHKAFVAFLDNVPAAFGWMAMGNARIGELNHEFTLPLGHRYLWNFRTLSEFRGRGIYPRLLQGIIALERKRSDCFWIIHAPENRYSQRGIDKAGFRVLGGVSVSAAGGVTFKNADTTTAMYDVLSTFGFSKAISQAASCWNCSSPYLKNKATECCCTAQQRECNKDLFIQA